MPTYVYTKQDFIKFAEQIEDGKVIVISNELSGNLSLSAKNGLKVNHVYAHDVFKDIGVGHIAFGKTTPIAILIADSSRLSEKGQKAIDQIK